MDTKIRGPIPYTLTAKAHLALGLPYCRCCTASKISDSDKCARCASGKCPACCPYRTGNGYHSCSECR